MRRFKWSSSLLVACTVSTAALSQEPIVESTTCPTVCCTESARSRGTWGTGIDALFVVPRFESNPAYFANRRTVTPGAQVQTNVQTVEEFDYDLGWSPRVWVQYSSECGWGGRVRWFHFDQAANPKTVTNPVIPVGSTTAFQTISSVSPLLAIASQTNLPGVNSIQAQGQGRVDDQLSFTSDLQMDMCDLDVTFNDLHTGYWGFELFGGVRFARIEQNYAAVSQGLFTQTITSRQTFEGAGPTFGLEGNRRLGSTRLSAYGLGRISFLFGNDEHDSTGLNIGLVPPFALINNDDHSSRDRILPVIDIEMGLEGTQPMGHAEVFARGGVFSQLIPLGSGANGNGNAGLIGLSLGTGVRY